MNYQLETFKEDLPIKLGTLLSKDIFWGTSSHYERQKSFTLSNNYYAYQVNDAVNTLCDALKDDVSKAKKESVALCKLYSDYEVPDRINHLNTFNDNLDNILKLVSTIKKGYKEIGKELNKPDTINYRNPDYKVMHNKLTEISQEMITASDLAVTVSNQIKSSLLGIKNESASIKAKASSGEINKVSKVMNFLKGKKTPNQEKIESTIKKRYR
jgi:hypothetical protein